MKDQQFRKCAFKAGKALCAFIGHKYIIDQCSADQDLDTIHNNLASIASAYYQTLKERRNIILSQVKKPEKGIKHFSAIRDRHGHLPFLLAAFGLVYEYFIPFEWIEQAFDSQMVKDVHMELKTGKPSALRSGKREAKRADSGGLTPKGSRENNTDKSDINNLCIYAFARFRSENPTLPEKVAFDVVFRDYIKKAFENTAIHWFNENKIKLSLTRSDVLDETRKYTRSRAFKKHLPEVHLDHLTRIKRHEEVGHNARRFCQEKFGHALRDIKSEEDEYDEVSVQGEEIGEDSIPCECAPRPDRKNSQQAASAVRFDDNTSGLDFGDIGLIFNLPSLFSATPYSKDNDLNLELP